MLSVTWAVNIWSEVPEYPLDFLLFPPLLQAVQGVESKQHTSTCSYMVHRKNNWRRASSSRWVVITFFSCGHCIHCTPFVWFERLLFSLLLHKHSISPDTRHTEWGEWCGPYSESLSLVTTFSLVPWRGLTGSGGLICWRELGNRALQSI